jgi:hypothetical protein
MPVPPRLAACLALALTAACAGPQAPDRETLALVARLPQENAGFTLQKAATPSASSSSWTADYRHAESGTTARVIISTAPPEPMPPGPDSAVVRAATNLQALAIQALTGGGGLTRLPDFGAGLKDQPPEIRCADLQLKPPEGTPTRMLSCNTGINGRLVTIAVVGRHQPEVAEKARLFMVYFAMLMTQALRSGEAQPPPPENAPSSARIFRL